MKRRLFLLGAMAAPAVVKAENLMKIWVPKKEVFRITNGIELFDLPFFRFCEGGKIRFLEDQRRDVQFGDHWIRSSKEAPVGAGWHILPDGSSATFVSLTIRKGVHYGNG